MLKLAVFACLLAVCYAQPPPPLPEFPETFTSRFDVYERDPRQHEERKGTGTWDRSETAMSFKESSTFVENGMSDYRARLGIFTTHMLYRINTTDAGKRMCEMENLPTDAKFPMEWDWLKDAAFHKFEDHRSNKTYDAWSVHGDMESKTVFAMEGDLKTPVGIMYRRKEFEEDRRFSSFAGMEPPSTAFTVPTECMTPPPKHH